MPCCLDDVPEGKCSDVGGIDRPDDACCVAASSVWMCEDWFHGRVVDDCHDCFGLPPPPPSVCEPIGNQGFVLDPIPLSSSHGREHCLRLDNFMDIAGEVVFSCVDVRWWYVTTPTPRLVVAGVVHQQASQSYLPWGVSSMQWKVYMYYAMDGLSSQATDTVFVIYNNNAAFTYSGRQLAGLSLELTLGVRFIHDPRSDYLYVAEGWLTSDNAFDDRGVQDWTGLLDCVDDPKFPPPPPDPRQNWCCECTAYLPSLVCFEEYATDPSGSPCGRGGFLKCDVIESCDTCGCYTNDDCQNSCCEYGRCVDPVNACGQCKGDELSCLEVECSVSLPCLSVDGVDILAELEELERKTANN